MVTVREFFAPIIVGQDFGVLQLAPDREKITSQRADLNRSSFHESRSSFSPTPVKSERLLTVNGHLTEIDKLLQVKRHVIAQEGLACFRELTQTVVDEIYTHACAAIEARSESTVAAKETKSRAQASQVKAWIEELREDYISANATLAQALKSLEPFKSGEGNLYAALARSKKAVALKLDPRVDLRRIEQEAGSDLRLTLDKIEDAFFQAATFKDSRRAAVFKLVFLTRAAHLCFANQKYEEAKSYHALAKENLIEAEQQGSLPLRLSDRIKNSRKILDTLEQDLNKTQIYFRRLEAYRAQSNQEEGAAQVLKEAVANPALDLSNVDGYKLAQDYFQTCIQAPLMAADVNAAFEALDLLRERLDTDLINTMYPHLSRSGSAGEEELLEAFRLYASDQQKNYQEILDAARAGLSQLEGPQTNLAQRFIKEALLWFECRILEETTQVGKNIVSIIANEYPSSSLLAKFLAKPATRPMSAA